MSLKIARKVSTVKDIVDVDVRSVGATLFIDKQCTEYERAEISQAVGAQHITVLSDGRTEVKL